METEVSEKSPKADLLYHKPGPSCERLEESSQVAFDDPCFMESGRVVLGNGMEVT